MSARPSRRAAASRRQVLDSSDAEDESPQSTQRDESPDDYTPAPSTRKPLRRKPRATEEQTPARTSQDDVFDPSEDQENIASPLPTKAPARKPPARKSVRASRKSIAPTLASESPPSTDAQQELRSPTIKEEDLATSKPLDDITDSTANEQRPVTQDESVATVTSKPIPEMRDAPMERPMDIVIRTRAKPQAINPEPVKDKPRMVITYLILNNFKSYAGKQVVGPFHASFSSVVGPNGSGKSNVIDSLLFVFGFRASKMRQGKLSSLIHNSAQYMDLDCCEVEVHFQKIIDRDNGEKEVVEGSNLVVSRKAFKNNSSKYYINNKESTFTVVTTMLKDEGIDLDHKRFLILQGEVESIAQMKPKAANEHDDGLLEYLEDIVGTSKYKQPIEEVAGETETLNEICQEKSGRVQHVEKEKKALEGKKNAAIAQIQDENELCMKQSALWQIYIHECNTNRDVTQETIDDVQQQLKDELEKHSGSEQELKQMEKQHSKGTKDFERLEQSTQAIHKQLAKVEKDSVKFEEKKKHLAAKVKKLEKQKSTSHSAVSEASAYLERLSEDLERNTAKLEELQESLTTEEAELAAVREAMSGKTQGLSQEISVKQRALEPFTQQIEEKQSSIAVAQSELNILQEREQSGVQALADIEAKIQRLQEERAIKSVEVEERQREKNALDKQQVKLESDLEKLNVQEPELRKKVSSARQKASEASASLAASQSQSNVLAGLMRLKESGRINGFYGRLGNLGRIDSKYDVAISTACPSLENLVVDSVDVGEKCIEYLRKNNLGRANFILLDRLAKRDMSEIDTPENVPRLFDLVQSKDEKFLPAFYSVLQNTLVANDLDQANRVAYGAKRWRVVTLDGQLIDKSGTMSGGGTRVAKGAMSSKIVAETSREQVVKLEADQSKEEERLKELQQRQQELNNELNDIKGKIPALENQIQRLNLDIENGERNIADAERRKTELASSKGTSSEEKAQRKKLEQTIAKLVSEIEKVQESSAELDQEIKDLQEKIMEIGGVKLRGQKAKVDGLKEQLESLSDEMSSAEASRMKTEKAKAKGVKGEQDAEQEMSTVEKDVEKLDTEMQAHQDSTAGTRKEAEEAQDALETKKDELAALKANLDERTAELNETRGIELEMRNKLEEHQKILAENGKRLKYWQEKLSKLELQSLEDLDAPEPTPESEPEELAAAEEQDLDAMDVDVPETTTLSKTSETDGDGDTTMTSAPPSPQKKHTSQPKKITSKSIALELPVYTPDELADLSKDHLKATIALLEEKTSNSSADLSVLSEYRRRVSEHLARSTDLATALSSRDASKRRLEELRRLRLEGFMAGFSAISLKLKEMYQLITLGGNAELELVDSLDPFSEGILFSVMPPKKSWKNISNLSGGEKTLSSLALVFALHHYRPTPLYVMDEIDAALDFRNVSIVASYIRERTRDAQFIVISLRNNMFELASRLVGVYKVNHMTKSVTVENRDFITR